MVCFQIISFNAPFKTPSKRGSWLRPPFQEFSKGETLLFVLFISYLLGLFTFFCGIFSILFSPTKENYRWDLHLEGHTKPKTRWCVCELLHSHSIDERFSAWNWFLELYHQTSSNIIFFLPLHNTLKYGSWQGTRDDSFSISPVWFIYYRCAGC